jgi:NADH-quinone oxidoreductase subunit C
VNVSDSRGQVVLHPTREQYIATLKALVDDTFVLCSDLTAVDYSTYQSRVGKPKERFEVVLNLISLERRERIRVRVEVPESDAVLPTAFDLYPGTEAMEREVFDMFGIGFDGHPDPSRILMPEDWEGHPLRKDYAIGRIPVQFKGSPT